MSERFQANSEYTYQTITAVTEKRLNELVEAANASPDKAEEKMARFTATFGLWFDITHDDPTPQRDKDGTRFLDLIPKFPEFE